MYKNIKYKIKKKKMLKIKNVFKILSNIKIKKKIKKDNGNVFNFIYNSLKLLPPISIQNITPDKISISLISLCAKILQNIAYHKELTALFLENKEYNDMIISIFFYIISSKEINTIYEEAYNIILKIVENIIRNNHKLFITYIISNNMHLAIKNKINYYAISHCINEKIFVSLMNIIGALFDSQKDDEKKSRFLKSEMNFNGLKEVIINIIVVFGKNEAIKKKCNKFCDDYYPNEPRENFVQLSNFNFLDLNL